MIERVAIAEPRRLYEFLGRTPAAEVADSKSQALRVACGDKLDELSKEVDRTVDAWSRGKSAFGVRSDEAHILVEAFSIVAAVLSGRHESIDMRTFSSRQFKNSKLVEDRKGAVSGILRSLNGWQGLGIDEIYDLVGLSKFPVTVLIRAPLQLRLGRKGTILDGVIEPFVGLPAETLSGLRLARPIEYVITIENLTSFQRYVREVTGSFAAIYTGGLAAAPVRTAIRSIFDQASAAKNTPVPVYHWGDIDGGGITIFRQVEKTLDVQVAPHLMSIEDAMALGTKVTPRPEVLKAVPSTSGARGLAEFLAGDAAHILEQEQVDPSPPRA